MNERLPKCLGWKSINFHSTKVNFLEAWLKGGRFPFNRVLHHRKTRLSDHRGPNPKFSFERDFNSFECNSAVSINVKYLVSYMGDALLWTRGGWCRLDYVWIHEENEGRHSCLNELTGWTLERLLESLGRKLINFHSIEVTFREAQLKVRSIFIRPSVTSYNNPRHSFDWGLNHKVSIEHNWALSVYFFFLVGFVLLFLYGLT